eukprot:jgi/Mesen1/3745/ME000204S03005
MSFSWSVTICSLVIAVAVFWAVLALCRSENVYEPRFWQKKRSETVDRIEESCRRAWKIVPPGKVLEQELWQALHGAINPLWLLAYRALAFLYVLNVTIFCSSRLGFITSYLWYTEWNYTMLLLYFGVATFVSARGCLAQFRSSSSSPASVERQPLVPAALEEGTCSAPSEQELAVPAPALSGPAKEAGLLGHIMQVFYQIELPMTLLVDAVLWTILYPIAVADHATYRIFNFLSINQHAINFLLAIGDFCLNSMRFPFFRVGYTLLWSASYVLMQWTVHYTYGLGWPYPFLENTDAAAPLWYTGMLLLHVFVHWLMVLLHRFKEKRYPAGPMWIASLEKYAT